MKYVTIFIVLACLLISPVFSQNKNQTRYKALSDSMDRTLSSSKTKLDNYTEEMNNSGNMKTYSSYNQKYNTLVQSLNEAEIRLDLLIRTNDRTVDIKEERDYYESLIKRLESTKSDYDSWMNSVK